MITENQTSSEQPKAVAATKSSNFEGNPTCDGDNDDKPADAKILATTRSSIKKGKNIATPRAKARSNSLTKNAANTTAHEDAVIELGSGEDAFCELHETGDVARRRVLLHKIEQWLRHRDRR